MDGFVKNMVYKIELYELKEMDKRIKDVENKSATN
jgi:hypothetical protein